MASATMAIFVFSAFSRTPSVSLTGKVTDPEQLRKTISFTNVFEPDPRDLFLLGAGSPLAEGERSGTIEGIYSPIDLLDSTLQFRYSTHSGWIYCWTVQLPKGVREAAQAGDELTVRAKIWFFAGFQDKRIKYGTWTLKRGAETLSFSDPANRSGLLILALLVSTPVLLWVAGASVTALVQSLKRPRKIP